MWRGRREAARRCPPRAVALSVAVGGTNVGASSARRFTGQVARRTGLPQESLPCQIAVIAIAQCPWMAAAEWLTHPPGFAIICEIIPHRP